jgi:hypothetical protein
MLDRAILAVGTVTRLQHLGRFDAYDLGATVLTVLSTLVLVLTVRKQPAGRRRLWPAPKPMELLELVLALSVTVLVLHQGVADHLCHGACWSH